jgi:ribosome-associated translation inhibitor RaiA
MRLTIVSRHLRLSEALRNHLERRAQFALGRFAAAIRTVRVSLADENGPRGDADKRCRVYLSQRRGKPIVVEGRGEQLESLVDRTLERAGRALARALKRMTERRTDGRPVL